MIIDRVTMTGADNSTDINALKDISAEFPFVEFGILVSKSSEGRYRFPSLPWQEELLTKAGSIKLSIHVCGEWTRKIMLGEKDFINERGHLLPMFQRIQLNFHGSRHKVNIDKLLALIKSDLPNKQIILQFDSVNNDIIFVLYGNYIDAVPVFDTSGGAGIVPNEWPEQLGIRKGAYRDFVTFYCGYAGGLGPDNLVSELARIEKVVNINEGYLEAPVWIDMETRVRSEEDSIFDLNKVRTCLKIVKDSGHLPKKD